MINWHLLSQEMDATGEVTVQISLFCNKMICGRSFFGCRQRIEGADSGYCMDAKVFDGLKAIPQNSKYRIGQSDFSSECTD